jgi:hypothetical protein
MYMQLQCNPITLVTTQRNMFYNAAVSNFTLAYKHEGCEMGLAVFIILFPPPTQNIATNFNYVVPKHC